MVTQQGGPIRVPPISPLLLPETMSKVQYGTVHAQGGVFCAGSAARVASTQSAAGAAACMAAEGKGGGGGGGGGGQDRLSVPSCPPHPLTWTPL